MPRFITLAQAKQVLGRGMIRPPPAYGSSKKPGPGRLFGLLKNEVL